MIKEVKGLIGAAAVSTLLLVALAGTANAAYYAKTISGNSIYTLTAETPDSAISSQAFWTAGTNLAGIAIKGQYMFVSDNTASGAVLHVMNLSGKYLGKVDLANGGNGIKSAGAVSVDNAGRVYVADTAQASSARFGVVYAPDWSNPTRDQSQAYGSVAGNWAIDVAAYADGAAIVGRNDNISGDIGGTNATTTDSNAVTTARGVLEVAPSIPVAITTDKARGNAYVATNVVTLDKDYNYVRNVSILGRSNNWDVIPSINIAGATADDLTFVSDGVTDYLALIGLDNSGLRAWKVNLTDGIPQLGPSSMFLANEQSATHNIAASEDGKMLWVTAQATGLVYGIDFSDFGATHPFATGLSTGYRIGAIATHETPVPTVPEPSSIVSLLAFGASAFGFWRKRK